MDRDDTVDILELVKRAAREACRSTPDGADGFTVMNSFIAKLDAEIEYQENK